MKKHCLFSVLNKSEFYCNAISPCVWHNRLGHFPMNKMHMLDSIECHVTDNNHVCEVCHLAKHKRSPFSVSTSRANASFQLIHTDIWDPFSVSAMNGEYYFLTLVDDYSMFTWVHLMKQKLETKHLLKGLCSFVERQFEAKV